MENAVRLAASRYVPVVLALAVFELDLRAWPAQADPGPGPEIRVSSTVPPELNPPFLKTSGGAPDATPAQAAAFAWQEFIALNWPAGPQQGKADQRDTPSSPCRFGDPECTGPTVWETFRGKVEIFPGAGKPPGYHGTNGDPSFGYDALPQYHYADCRPGLRCQPGEGSGALDQPRRDRPDQPGQHVCRHREAEQLAGQQRPAAGPLPGQGQSRRIRLRHPEQLAADPRTSGGTACRLPS